MEKGRCCIVTERLCWTAFALLVMGMFGGGLAPMLAAFMSVLFGSFGAIKATLTMLAGICFFAGMACLIGAIVMNIVGSTHGCRTCLGLGAHERLGNPGNIPRTADVTPTSPKGNNDRLRWN